MKKVVNILFVAGMLFTSLIAYGQKGKRDYYQIKTYTLTSVAQEQRVDKYLQDAFLPALHRQGIQNVGVFKPITNKSDSSRNIYVLIPFRNLEQFNSLENKLAADKQYLSDGDDYINTNYTNPAFARVESILLFAFSDMPVMQTPKLTGPRTERVYELRSYESASESYYRNKVDMFNAGGEIKLFDKLQFNAIFYGEVISGPVMPNLMYMTSFENQASRDAHWKSFSDAPEWKELVAMEKYKNNVSHIDITFLYPTEYSDY
ncbi:MAG: NIPSNAP family protein [Cyclobacteriaceae bacterium]|nr:NIPSNAP family protein [Cyclobacteriaceae bacterium]